MDIGNFRSFVCLYILSFASLFFFFSFSFSLFLFLFFSFSLLSSLSVVLGFAWVSIIGLGLVMTSDDDDGDDVTRPRCHEIYESSYYLFRYNPWMGNFGCRVFQDGWRSIPFLP